MSDDRQESSAAVVTTWCGRLDCSVATPTEVTAAFPFALAIAILTPPKGGPFY